MSLEDFETRARAAEDAIDRLQAEVSRLRLQIGGRSQHVLGLPSTMGDDYQLNLKQLMDRCVQCQPDVEVVTAVVENGGMGYHRMSWREVIARATRLASALAKAGVQPGDRVATFMWNNSRHLQLYYAVPAMGAVCHTLNIRLHPNELKYIVQHAEDKILFVDSTILPLLQRVDVEAFRTVEKIVVCGPNEQAGNWESTLPRTIDFDEFLETGDFEYDWPDLDERSAMGLCYTSGTTGNPKGVLYSHRSTYIHTLANATTDVFNVSGTDVILPVVPMFHALAWGIPFHAMMIGYKLVFYNHFRTPPQLLKMIQDQNVTTCAGVPTVIQGFMREMESNPKAYESLRGVFRKLLCGGSAPPRVCIEYFWNAWEIEVIQGWGMTETNPVASIARRCTRFSDLTKTEEEKTENNVSAGAFMTCVDRKLVGLGGDFKEEVPHDGVSTGELLVRGPFVTRSYYKIDTPEKFIDGWLVTGDIASITEENRLYIRDRSKDLIKSGGEWISSVDMENRIMGLSQVKMACVVAVPHPRWQERPIVVACLKNSEDILTLDAIHELLKEHFAKFQLPDELLVWEDIPLTGTGKMAKKLVREKLVEQGYVLPSLR